VLKRETIIRELWSRFADVEDIEFTARNPKAPPGEADFPCILFFELGDDVFDRSKRGATQKPSFKRKLIVVVETYVKASTEEASSAEMMDMIEKIKKKLYVDGNSLGGLCEINETGSSRVLRPPMGGPVAGLGLSFEITYIEDVGALFT
jgi:hypothetical protein